MTTIAGEAPLTVGVDIGGTKIGVVLVDAAGTVLEEHRHATEPEQGATAVLQRIAECVRDCFPAARGRIGAAGVGVAGQVDASSGSVTFAPNLAWRNVPVRALLERDTGLPVAVTNDVRAATWGEWLYGAGVGADDLVVMFIGTGVGGGIVSGGRVITGSGNSAGEIGHLTVLAGGRRCRCGNTGCLEAYAGGWALGERAREAAAGDAAAGAAMLRLAGSLEAISAEEVTRAWREGDALAGSLIADARMALEAAAIGVVNLLNPARLIVGGGVAAAVPEFAEGMARAVAAGALPAPRAGVRVVASALGRAAPAVGAAAFARRALLQRRA